MSIFVKGERVKVLSYPDGTLVGLKGTITHTEDYLPFVEAEIDGEPSWHGGWLFRDEELQRV